MYIVCDLESNGLLDTVSRVWCLCAIDSEGKRFEAVGHDQIRQLLTTVASYPTSVWHNGIGYDQQVIRKVLGFNLENVKDTLLLSQILNPDRIFDSSCS